MSSRTHPGAPASADYVERDTRVPLHPYPAAHVSAAQKIPASAGWLVSSPARIAERRGRNIATVATARKLLTLVYYGLRDRHIRALAPAEAAA